MEDLYRGKASSEPPLCCDQIMQPQFQRAHKVTNQLTGKNHGNRTLKQQLIISQISDHAVLHKQDSIASAADHADSAYHTYTVTKQRYGTYNLSKGNSFMLLLDTSSVGVRVQEESTHVPLRLKRILLWLTLLRFHYLLLLADVVIVVQAILVRTHGFRIFILLRRYICAFDVQLFV